MKGVIFIKKKVFVGAVFILFLYFYYNALSLNAGSFERIPPLKKIKNKIAFQEESYRELNKLNKATSEKTDIYLAGIDGSSKINITEKIEPEEKVFFAFPKWSPDGRYLAFLGIKKGELTKKEDSLEYYKWNISLYRANSGGTNIVKLYSFNLEEPPAPYSDEITESTIIWLNKGKLAFLDFSSKGKGKYTVIDAETLRVISTNNTKENLKISQKDPFQKTYVAPDGFHVIKAFTPGSGTFTSIDFRPAKILSGYRFSFLKRKLRYGYMAEPNWLPDSRHFIFVDTKGESDQFYIYVMDIKGKYITYPGNDYDIQPKIY